MSNVTTAKPTLLIVDDTPENLSVLCELLRADYQLKPVLNGRLALKIAQSATPPDLILLDIVMPEMDGYEVLRQLKANELTRDIPVLLATAITGNDDERPGLELGALDYISKPYSPALVQARVRNYLQLAKFMGGAKD